MGEKRTTKDEAMEFLIEKGYCRIIATGPETLHMKVEICNVDRQALLNLQQTFGGRLRPQDSVYRWSCGRATDMAHIAVNLAPFARALAIEMQRYCRSRGKQRYTYVEALRDKYGGNSIKIAKFTDIALEQEAGEAET